MATKKVTKKAVKATTKKKATKKVVKKAVKKPATKKAVAIAKVKALKHKKVLLEPIGTESLPDMLCIAGGPAWAREIVGKRYVNLNYATIAIDMLDAERNIAKGAKYVAKEMVSAGVTPLDNTEIDTEEK